MSTEIIAALLGAVAAGLLQTFVLITQRRHEAEATLVAIASEVTAICTGFGQHLIRDHVARQMAAMRGGTWDGHGVIIDAKENYTAVFDANAGNLGKLKRDQAAAIVAFYYAIRSLRDAARPDGLVARSKDRDFIAANLVHFDRTMTEALELGAKIARLPAVDLPTPWIDKP